MDGWPWYPLEHLGGDVQICYPCVHMGCTTNMIQKCSGQLFSNQTYFFFITYKTHIVGPQQLIDIPFGNLSDQGQLNFYYHHFSYVHQVLLKREGGEIIHLGNAVFFCIHVAQYLKRQISSDFTSAGNCAVAHFIVFLLCQTTLRLQLVNSFNKSYITLCVGVFTLNYLTSAQRHKQRRGRRQS